MKRILYILVILLVVFPASASADVQANGGEMWIERSSSYTMLNLHLVAQEPQIFYSETGVTSNCEIPGLPAGFVSPVKNDVVFEWSITLPATETERCDLIVDVWTWGDYHNIIVQTSFYINPYITFLPVIQ